MGRLRHGLLTQEFLDRLARAGFVIYPYFITIEDAPVDEVAGEEGQDDRIMMRWLGPEDVGEIARITARKTDTTYLLARLDSARCMGAFLDGSLVGVSWASTVQLPIPYTRNQALFRLAPDELYLFDMYVSPEHRGLRLAGRLRSRLYREFMAEGRTRRYSVTLAFNRSSRRFKARLGASEVELRIYLQLRFGSLPGIDLRLWRGGQRLVTPAVRRVRSFHRSASTPPAGAHA
jgi:GNAT superfamily N-acetyltransferase